VSTEFHEYNVLYDMNTSVHKQSPQNIQHKHSFLGDTIKFALIAVVIVVPFRLFIAQPFIVNGQSMEPTFNTGEYLIIDQISYQFTNPKRGDVIVFRYPNNPEKFYIKRLIGLPGETITISDGKITITNDAHPNGFNLKELYINTSGSTNLQTTLGSHEYFVLGDNRKASSDSRRWGPLHRRFIQGRPIARLFPITEIDILPGIHRVKTK